MKWICPGCPELNHGTRHESVLRHIRRKHDSIGEPINLNSGFTRRQLGLNPNRQSPYSGGLPTRPQSFAPTNISKSRTFDLCDWTECNILRPMRQQVELMSLMKQFNASSLGANLPNVSQGITGSYSTIWMHIGIVDLFGCKALVCGCRPGIEIHPFYFQDSKEVKPRSTIIEHICPEYSYTRLRWISDENKKHVRDHTERLHILKTYALNHWNKSGLLYFLGIRIPNSYVQCVRIADPNNQDKSFIIQYSLEDIIDLDHMSKNHWVNKIMVSEKELKEVSLYDPELDDFLIATNFATFGFCRINNDECYFIMLANHPGLTLTLVN